MKKLIVLLMLVISSIAQAGKIEIVKIQKVGQPEELRVYEKFTSVKGDVDKKSYEKFRDEFFATMSLPGERLIKIDSRGGEVFFGEKMIKLLKLEKAIGVKHVCVVENIAASMAFNLLSICDERYSAKTGRLLFHRVRTYLLFALITIPDAKKLLQELEEIDLPYAKINAKALDMDLETYTKLADMDIVWDAADLLEMGYLDGFSQVVP